MDSDVLSIFKTMIKEAQKIEKDKKIQLRKTAKKLYDMKEIFKEAGFTETQSFNLLQTLISVNNGGTNEINRNNTNRKKI